jgi:hypothetical protein
MSSEINSGDQDDSIATLGNNDSKVKIIKHDHTVSFGRQEYQNNLTLIDQSKSSITQNDIQP